MHSSRHTLIALLALCLILPLAAPAAATHPARQSEPVTLYSFSDGISHTVDPQVEDAAPSIAVIENLFLGLTDIHPETAAIVPELAAGWTVSADGLIWTFTLRDDVPWVRWNPATQTSHVVRMVTAHDVVFGMQRACDPRLSAYYTSVVAPVIVGCDALARKPVEDVTDADYGLVQVFALDDTTLEVHLQHAAAYILSMTALSNLRPVPREVIEEHGADWTNAEHIVTNGPYLLTELEPGARAVLFQNPNLPDDLRGPGNIERNIVIGAENWPALYEAHQLDVGGWVPPGTEDQLTTTDQLLQNMDLVVLYFGFTLDKPPFDNVHVRRAFSAAIDRTQFEAGYWGVGIAMRHFTPPGIFGAPPIGAVGVGSDAEYAREQLALAGYPNCEGFPTVNVLTLAFAPIFTDALVADAETVLGCDPALFEIDAVSDAGLLIQIIDPELPPEDRPHIWYLGWGPDYPDAHNWVHDVLSCDAWNAFKRPCTENDDLIDQAAVEADVAVRADIYRDIEERFFGPDGEFPMAPLVTTVQYTKVKTWFNGPFETDGLFGGAHLDWYTIDQEAQLAARGG